MFKVLIAKVWVFVVLVLITVLFSKVLEKYPLATIVAEIRNLEANTILALLVLTVVNFFVLGVMEAAALHREKLKIPLYKAFLSGFVSNAFSYTLGAPLLVGSAVRARLYINWGLPRKQVLDLILLLGFHYWVAIFFIGASLALWLSRAHVLELVSPSILQLVFLLATIIVGAYFWLVRKRRMLKFRNLRFVTPPQGVVVVLFFLSLLDVILHSLIYHFSIPGNLTPFSLVAFAFCVSQVGGLISNVPAGLGVFEGLGFLLLKDSIKHEALLAGMLVYRFFMYICPFVLASVIFALTEIYRDAKKTD